MIKVSVVRDNKEISSLKVEGHSGYEDLGKDIVCSAVSEGVILTINLLERLKVDFNYTSDESIPLISLSINKGNEMNDLIQVIMENLVSNLYEISNEFKKYLKIYEI